MREYFKNRILKITSIFMLLALMLAPPLSVFSAFNKEINYQGKLTDSAGTSVADGIYHMKFRLYSAQTGGTNLWEGNRSSNLGDRVSVSSGLFSVMLGSSTPLTSIDFNQTLWLEVEVGGTASTTWETLSPRKKLGAVPSAFEADKLDGIDSLSFLRSDASDTFDSGSTLTVAGTFDSNGDISFADTTVLFDGASTDFGITGDLTFNTNQFSLLKSSGNVGIGTTSPYAKLSVWGAGTGSATAFNVVNNASSTLFSVLENGFVGVGTTSPFQLFSVAGQCVTGDTKLRRRRKKKRKTAKAVGDGNNNDDEYIYDEVAIKDIVAGDEIQSLDEKTGKMVWSKVNALMYMGNKQTYRLTTASGKTIRTTDNHPYFAQSPIKLSKKPRIGVFYDSSNMYKAQEKVGWRVSIKKLKKELQKSFSVEFINYYNAIPREEDDAREGMLSFMKKIEKLVTFRSKPLKYISFWREGKKVMEKKGDMDVDIALDVTESLNDIDIALVISGDSDLLPLREYMRKRNKKVSFASFRHNMAWELTKGGSFVYLDDMRETLKLDLDGVFSDGDNSNNGVNKMNSETKLGVTLTNLLYTKRPSMSSGLWKKVKMLKEGDMIAVNAGGVNAKWDRIISIEPVAQEDVYDIEVQGTHNFIGNDIVAHNTYIQGTTTIANDLQVDTNTLFVDSANNMVGVGTTSPYAKLSVVGEIVGSYFTATTTATSTLAGGLNVRSINQTGSATSTFANGIELSGGCFKDSSGSCITNGAGGTPGGSDGQIQYNNGGSFGGGNAFIWDDINERLGIGTTSPYAKLSVVGEIVGSYFTATTTATSTLPRVNIGTALTLGSDYITDFTGTGLQMSGTALTLNATGDWTGTFDGQEGSYYLNAANLTNFGTPFYTFFSATNTTALSEGTNLYYTDARVDSRINASSTIPSVGGTSYGDILSWSGTRWERRATSTIATAITDTTGTLVVSRGGTGLTSYTPNELIYASGAGTIAQIATSSLGLLTTNVAEGTNLYWTDARFDARLAASTTIPTLTTLANLTTVGTIGTGVWQGTAIGDTYVADDITLTNITQITNRAISDTTGTLAVGRGGTGQTSFGQGWLHSDGTTFTASTSPTVNYIVATSTTATSTLAGGLNVRSINQTGSATSTFANGIELSAGCFSVSGTCVGGASTFLALTDTMSSFTAGSLLFTSGSAVTQDNASLFFDDTNNRFGIGTTSPYARLSVSGNTVLDSTLVRFASTTASILTVDYATSATSTILDSKLYAWTIATSTTATPIFRIDTSGIGGASGAATSTFTGGFSINSGAFLYDSGANKTSIERLNLGAISFDDDAGWISWVDLPVTTIAASGVTQAYSAQIDANQIFTIYSQADGAGGIKNVRTLVGTSTDAVLSSSNIPYGSLLVADGALCIDNGGALNCDDSARSSGSLYAFGTGSNYFAGNLGIGTTSPYAKLSVVGEVVGSYFTATTTATSTFAGPIAHSTGNLIISRGGSGNLLLNPYGGNVGIGTTTPNTIFSVSGTTTIGTLSTATQAGLQIGYGGLCVDDDGACVASTTGRISSVSSTVGNSDLAEMYKSSNLLEAGDIVMTVQSSSQPHEPEEFSVDRATLSNRNSILGVVSTAPGIILGFDNEPAQSDQYPVALSGRVPTKVSLENGPIKIGDNITLSLTMPGTGMKATTSSMMIGVALQDFDGYSIDKNGSRSFSETGYVSVFINVGYVQMKESFASNLFSSILKWFENVGVKIANGVIRAKEFVANRITADEVCIGKTCINEAQLQKLINGGGVSTNNGGGGGDVSGGSPSQPTVVESSKDTISPTVTLQGNNPAKVEIGIKYSDLGAVVTDNVDNNLGYKVSVNGGEFMDISKIKINTDSAGEHTITFEATDQAGNIGTAVRKVIVYDKNSKTEESAKSVIVEDVVLNEPDVPLQQPEENKEEVTALPDVLQELKDAPTEIVVEVTETPNENSADKTSVAEPPLQKEEPKQQEPEPVAPTQEVKKEEVSSSIE